MMKLVSMWMPALVVSVLACESEPSAPAVGSESSTVVEPEASALADVVLPAEVLRGDRVRLAQPRAVSRVPRVVRVTGSVNVSPNGAAVLSAPTEARVAKLAVQAGQTVRKGDVLAVLEAPAVAVARAELLRSEALQARAERLVEQERELERLNATSERDSSLARQELALARAGYAAAEGNLRAWGTGKQGGAGVTLRAPFAGVVTDVGVAVGSTVPAGTMLARLLQPNALSVVAHVPQGSASQIEVGTDAVLTATGQDSQCSGHVLGHFARVEAASGTVPYRVAIPPDCPLSLLEGAVVELELPLLARAHDRPGFFVDASAVSEYRGRQVIFQSVGEGRFRPRFVEAVEVWAEQAYFQADDLEALPIAVSGIPLLKGELMRGELE